MLDFLKRIDVDLFLILNGHNNSFFDFCFYWISDKWIWIPFYGFLLFLVIKEKKQHTWFVLIFIALAITLSDQISSAIIKEHIMRLRPCHDPEISSKIHLVNGYCGGTYGFVSSHAANVFALATFFSGFLKNKYSGLLKVLWIWAAIVSYSRIYLGVHFPGDVLGGVFVGVISGFVAIYGYQKLIHKLPQDKFQKS